MGRPPRITEPGVAYHLLNRRVMRLTIFEKDEDYAAFERVLAEGLDRPDAPKLLAYCLMPNHWHLVGQAGEGTDLSTWMQWVTVTHTHRWHAHYHSTGEGPLYQGRFKSFPVQEDVHFLTLCRVLAVSMRDFERCARGGADGRGITEGCLRRSPGSCCGSSRASSFRAGRQGLRRGVAARSGSRKDSRR